ncbi:hypothetical protein AX16_010333 [Volvariella volvacea WC 439]|nr:hypothetical protein AX16_010333 [Volvariella volvacea WC 439]
MADFVSLFCLVYGEPFARAFEVEIRGEKSVSILKKLIITEKVNDFKGIDADHLDLWKVEIPITKSELPQSPELKDEDELAPTNEISKEFPREPLKKRIHIIVKVAADATVTGSLKRVLEGRDKEFLRQQSHVHSVNLTCVSAFLYLHPFEPPHKLFKANSTVYPEYRKYIYYADQTASNAPLIDAIGKGDFALDVSSKERFWSDLYLELEKFSLPVHFNNPTTFIKVFSPNKRWTCPVILFFDKFDKLHDDTATEACSSMLETIRRIRNEPTRGTPGRTHVIHSIISISTFAILTLDHTNERLSPFNAAENFAGESLTKAQVQELFGAFENDRQITIDPMVIDDIFQLTDGHAGLVNVCGAAIQNDLLPLKDRTLNLARWQNFIPSLLGNVLEYSTFERMVKSLKRQKDAVDCLRSRFLGHFNEFVSVLPGGQPLAEFLAALGVLSPKQRDRSQFKMTSPIVDSLIRQRIIPIIYPIALMAKVKVDGYKNRRVPRESVYDSELMRILSSWLKQESCSVTGQWHHVDGSSHRYSDIVINEGLSKIVLEFLATGDSGFIKEYIERTRKYKANLGAEEAWVIHFTCEDNYLEHPCWQSDELLDGGIYMAHIWHNLDFTEVRMSAKWKSWNGENKVMSNECII